MSGFTHLGVSCGGPASGLHVAAGQCVCGERGPPVSARTAEASPVAGGIYESSFRSLDLAKPEFGTS